MANVTVINVKNYTIVIPESKYTSEDARCGSVAIVAEGIHCTSIAEVKVQWGLNPSLAGGHKLEKNLQLKVVMLHICWKYYYTNKLTEIYLLCLVPLLFPGWWGKFYF